MSAIFNFQSMMTCVLLLICCCSYLRPRLPSYINPKRQGFLGVLGRCAVIGDRLSPYVSASLVAMAGARLFLR